MLNVLLFVDIFRVVFPLIVFGFIVFVLYRKCQWFRDFIKWLFKKG